MKETQLELFPEDEDYQERYPGSLSPEHQAGFNSGHKAGMKRAGDRYRNQRDRLYTALWYLIEFPMSVRANTQAKALLEELKNQ
jgi:hypothetical protein